MADQGAVNLFMVVSMIALWVMVAGLTGIHIAEYLKKRTRMRAVILDSRGEARDEHELGKQKELLIGKSAPANLVNIDFSDSAYAASIEEDHAALVRNGAYWYVCARANNGMVGLKQKGGEPVYKLQKGILYRIQRGDTIYISYEKIVIQ
ncbi:hypothetical protein [Otoolea muris]|jgi:hypothetical protein|uniref:hypothetical protein n=1 Tax=Otoolea muris TaxID=2941515 RepID=UPI001364A5F1|nr:hypothetical protein [Otoolea muris]MCI9584816.1 hypothetical protein [Clostridium sp.]